MRGLWERFAPLLALLNPEVADMTTTKATNARRGVVAQETTIKLNNNLACASDAIALVQHKSDMLVDSRLIAKNIGIQHKHAFEQIKNFKSDFEEIGILRFKTEEIEGRGQPEKYALLNEDQAYLLLTFCRNTARVRSMKVKLIIAFRDVRLAQDLTKREYLPSYHALHDVIHSLAAQSNNEHLVHMNFNKLINKTVGIQSGSRDCLNLAQRSMLVVAQAVAANASHDASDHRDGYTKAKEALKPLEACKLIGGAV